MVRQNQWKILGGGKKSSIKLGWQISTHEYPSFDTCGSYCGRGMLTMHGGRPLHKGVSDGLLRAPHFEWMEKR